LPAQPDIELDGLEQRCDRFRSTFVRLRDEIERAIIGCRDIVEGTLLALCCGGHVLLEGAPGLGKTVLVRAIASALGVRHARVQCTPDLMPADITGCPALIESPGAREFRFQPGPIFANLVHVDEINRATPKTQASLLEAMQERAVTVGGYTHALPRPFLVLATQNPIEMEGTFPLPEAELDRFFFKLRLELPALEALVDILRLTTGSSVDVARRVTSEEDIAELTELPRLVVASDDVLRRAARIVRATHPNAPEAPEIVRRSVQLGASPRAAQALVLGGKVRALLSGRFNTAHADVDAVVIPALRHRLLLTLESQADGIDAERVVQAAVDAVATRR
jgi:MoxR-like ATPase